MCLNKKHYYSVVMRRCGFFGGTMFQNIFQRRRLWTNDVLTLQATGPAPRFSPRAILSKIVFCWDDESLEREKSGAETTMFWQQSRRQTYKHLITASFMLVKLYIFSIMHIQLQFVKNVRTMSCLRCARTLWGRVRPLVLVPLFGPMRALFQVVMLR